MRVISPFLKHAVYPALHHSGWLKRMAPIGGFAVINYHGLVPAEYKNLDPFLDGNLLHPENFRRQLRYLKQHYRILHPREFRASLENGSPLPARSIMITCDDGLLNTLTGMLPILRDEDLPCLFFVTGASCGPKPVMLWYEELYRIMRAGFLPESLQLPSPQPHSTASQGFPARWWNMVRAASKLSANERGEWMTRVRQAAGIDHALQPETRWRLLNPAELTRLSGAGMEIGAHTVNHPVLSLCRDAEAWHEIKDCKAQLELAVGREVWAFAYPFGNAETVGEREIGLARRAGYDCAFLNVERWNGASANRFAWPRIHVSLSTTLPEFAAHLSGLHFRLQRAAGG